MNDNIRETISEAGFSSTYEADRLTALCKITALQCIALLLESGSVPSGVAAVCKHFDLEVDDVQFE